MSLRRPIWASQRFPGGSGLWRGGLWTSQQAASLSPTAQIRQTLFGNGQGGIIYHPKPMVDGAQVLWEMSDGTIAVDAHDDPVGRMDDLSGNGNNASQATVGSKPLYKTDGTIHWLGMDGVNDYLDCGDIFPVADFTASFLIGTQGLSGDEPAVFGAGSTSSNGILWYANTSFGTATNQMRVVFQTEILIGPDIRDTGDRLLTLERSGSTFNLYVDGAIEATGTQSGNVTDRILWLGAWESGARFFNGDKYGPCIIIDYSGGGAREEMESYLAELWGLTL